MSLRERLKAKKAREKTVAIDGDNYLIRGLGRVEKIKLIERCTVKGKVDSGRFEAEYLAACVLDPETMEQVEPNWEEWTVPVHISDPLFAECMEVCGVEGTTVTIEKNLNATES